MFIAVFQKWPQDFTDVQLVTLLLPQNVLKQVIFLEYSSEVINTEETQAKMFWLSLSTLMTFSRLICVAYAV